ncbi:MAG: thioredoxin family protein [Thermoguttaceae bacterium]|nr:thioredoxin family protein [Thermoguttaceae bacterium]
MSTFRLTRAVVVFATFFFIWGSGTFLPNAVLLDRAAGFAQDAAVETLDANANASAAPSGDSPFVAPSLLDPFANDPFASNPFGGDANADANAPLSVAAQIAPLPASVADDASPTSEIAALDAELAASGRKLVGFLTLQTTAATGWHIYSPTQGDGGSPTKISVDAAPTFEVGPFRLATPFKVVESTGFKLEELTGTADWIAPISVAADAAPADVAAFLADLKATGKVSALACSDGEGGSCFPQNVEFSAAFDATRAVAPIWAAAEKLVSASAAVDASKTEVVADATVATGVKSAQTGKTVKTDAGAPAEKTSFASRRFALLLLYAFLGGLILNATPCVLPVIGLKIMSFFDQAGQKRSKAFMLNVWYTLGVSVVFFALAFASVGLSFLFTRALFQILMSVIVFALALSLMGLWELQAPAFLGGQKSNELTSKEGSVGAFFKGLITTLLAIPCGAPLLSPTLDWAAETARGGETALVVVVYLVIGLGMSSPFLLAGAFPELLKFFPKPGAWMETFRKTMGYFLLIAVAWILYSAPLDYQLPTVALLFAIWFACWNVGRNQFEYGPDAFKKKAVGWSVSALVVAAVVLCSFDFPGNPLKTTLRPAVEKKMLRWAERAEKAGLLAAEKEKPWRLFDRATLDAELAAGRVVVVDFTADWCVNCKFLEKTILHTPEALDALSARGVVTMTADWTNQDAQTPDVLAINELLDATGARQVPKLMFFSPADPENPVVLSGLYSADKFFETLNQFAPEAEKTSSKPETPEK